MHISKRIYEISLTKENKKFKICNFVNYLKLFKHNIGYIFLYCYVNYNFFCE